MGGSFVQIKNIMFQITYPKYLTPGVVVYVRFVRFADREIRTRRRSKFDKRYTIFSLDRLLYVYTLFIYAHLMCSPNEYAIRITTPRIAHCNEPIILRSIVEYEYNLASQDFYSGYVKIHFLKNECCRCSYRQKYYYHQRR